MYVIYIHSLDPLFLKGGGGVNFNYLSQREKPEKLKDGVEVWYRGRSS